MALNKKKGLELTRDECVVEACMATNSVLVYNSSSPNQALLRFEPRDLYTLESKGLSSVAGATSTRLDLTISNL